MLRVIAWGLVLSALQLAGPAVWADGQEEQIKRGESLVKSRCVVCHTEKSLPALVRRCSDRRGEKYLDGFLVRHHAPDKDARADIIAFLTCDPAKM